MSSGRVALYLGGDILIGTLLLVVGLSWHDPLPAVVVYLGGVFMAGYLLAEHAKSGD